MSTLQARYDDCVLRHYTASTDEERHATYEETMTIIQEYLDTPGAFIYLCNRLPEGFVMQPSNLDDPGPTTMPCPWCDGAGGSFHDSEDGIDYGPYSICQRCNGTGEVEAYESPVDSDEYDEWGGTNRRYE